MEHGTSIVQDGWTQRHFRQLANDFAAATISATLVAPPVTIIDRAIVESTAFNQPMFPRIAALMAVALKQPKKLFFHRSFGVMWALYAATFSVANGTDTLCREFQNAAAGTITFLSTTVVNVPLGVWKDIRFAQMFGRASDSKVEAGRSSAIGPLPVQARGAARIATMIFLMRDSITIFGSFTLAPWLSEHTNASLAATQLTVPVLTQLGATPLHLLGLDLYTRQHSVPLSNRIAQSSRHLPSATAVRCIRIIPAFGFGCLANMELRSFFHRQFAA